MKYFIVNIYSFIILTSAYSEVKMLDDFSDSNFNKVVNSFYDSSGKKIEVYRKSLSPNYYIKNSTLYFDGALKNQEDDPNYSLNYVFINPENNQRTAGNIRQEPLMMNFNFSNISRPFRGKVTFSLSDKEPVFIEHDFTKDNLNPAIKLFTDDPDKTDFTGVYNINFEVLNSNGNLDDLQFSITSITTTPEPITLMTSAAGLLSLIHKKSKKKFNKQSEAIKNFGFG